MYRERWPPAG